jgi:flagellar motor switch protein FliG
MTALRKAAVLLASLPHDEAAKLLAKLAPIHLEAVSIEIAKLNNVTADEQSDIIHELAAVDPGAVSGGLDVAQALLEKALGNDAAGTIDNLRQQIEPLPFGFLRNIDTRTLSTFIIDEHPQTIALVICHLSPAQAANILATLPSDRQLSIVRRIASMAPTNAEVVKDVARVLQSRIAAIPDQHFENAGGVQSAAKLLNVADRATERNLLEHLTQESPDLAAEIRRRMGTLEEVDQPSSESALATSLLPRAAA